MSIGSSYQFHTNIQQNKNYKNYCRNLSRFLYKISTSRNLRQQNEKQYHKTDNNQTYKLKMFTCKKAMHKICQYH